MLRRCTYEQPAAWHLLLAELAKFSVQWHNGIRGPRRASSDSLSSLSTRARKKDTQSCSRLCLKAWSLRTGQFTQVSIRHAVELLLNSSESECTRRKKDALTAVIDPAQKLARPWSSRPFRWPSQGSPVV